MRPLCAVVAMGVAALCAPSAVADADNPKPRKPKRQSVADCASFDQRDRADEDGVDFTIASRCEVKLRCGIQWALTCAPGTKQAKKTRQGVAFELENGHSEAVTASATTCGFEGWEISDISWSCQPVK